MSFVNPDITEIIPLLDKLKENSRPNWGEMSAQRMIEHLTDIIKISSGKTKMSLLIPEDRIEKMQTFLESDKEMAHNIEVPFAPKNVSLRNEEIELAIDEFLLEWIDFETHFGEDETKTELHPYYGQLNYNQWCSLHSKHITHHLKQFGVLE